MGQVSTSIPAQSLILTSLDRLVASNADGGLSPLASHVVLLGESAGANMGALSYVYVIGASALDAGLATAAKSGTVVIGGLNLSALTDAAAAVSDGPLVVIGYNNFPQQTGSFGRNVLIGTNIGANMPAGGSDISETVAIGPSVLRYQRILAANGGNGFDRSVFIGSRVMRGSATTVTDGGGAICADSVVIGDRAMELTGTINVGIPGATASFNVVIGAQAGLTLARDQNSTATNNVIIGNQCMSGQVNMTNGVMVGAGITAQGGNCSQFTLLGNGIVGGAIAGSTGNTVLGSLASLSGVGSYNILIGAECNATAALAASSAAQLLIETNPGCLVYGKFATAAPGPGGLIIGHSVAANRDIPGFNLLKLINGARDAGLTAPVGGGYFYSTGGIVHWVSTGNLDYNLTSGGSLGAFTVATLPAAPPAYSRAFVTDAAAPAFAAAPVGGGAVVTPVYFNGAAWLCG